MKKYVDDLVSVIMPAYNAERYIDDSIKSVINQSYKKLELIIVDDCSTDSTALIVEKYIKSDSRIKYYINKENSGVAITRNNAEKYANGRYIAFLDSDDLWVTNKLELQLQFMREKKSSFSFGNYEMIDENGRKKQKVVVAPSIVTYDSLLKGSKIGCLTVIYDRKLVKWPSMKSVGHEDYLAWLEILKLIGSGHGIKQTLGYYRQMNNSLSGNKFKSAKWQFKIYTNVLDFTLLKSVWLFSNYAINAITKQKKI